MPLSCAAWRSRYTAELEGGWEEEERQQQRHAPQPAAGAHAHADTAWAYYARHAGANAAPARRMIGSAQRQAVFGIGCWGVLWPAHEQLRMLLLVRTRAISPMGTGWAVFRTAAAGQHGIAAAILGWDRSPGLQSFAKTEHVALVRHPIRA